MTVAATELARISALARRMAALNPNGPEQIALLSFMAGILYALARAVDLQFDDARMTPDLAKVPAELRQTLGALSNSTRPPEAWTSGFYVDSAMMRISALNVRANVYLGRKRSLGPAVPEVVNMLKHDVDAGIGTGWNIRFDDTIKAAEDLGALLETAVR